MSFSTAIVLVTILAWVEPQDPAILQIHIVEGEGAVYGVGSRATRGVTIQVTDETGKPVEGASVSFRLPETGPTGTFASGGKTEIATTGAGGRAGVWGMRWNATVGSFEIRITAEKGQARAGTICTQYLTNAVEKASQGSRIGPGGNHKWLWIAAGIAGAAGAGIAATAAKAKPSAGPVPSASVTIGAPTISLGKP